MMPVDSLGNPVIPFGHPNDFTLYVEDTEYFGTYYIHVVKKLNQLWSFEARIMDVYSDDDNVQFGRTVKIFSQHSLMIKGRIDSCKYNTDGTATISGYGVSVVLAGTEYTDRTSWTETTTDLVKTFLSINNDKSSPWIITPGNIDDYGEKIEFRAEFDNKMEVMIGLANQLEWDWRENYGDYPFNSNTFDLVEWTGSIAPVYEVNLSGSNQNAIMTNRDDNMKNLINSIIYLGKGEGTDQIYTQFDLVSNTFEKIDTTITDLNTPVVLTTGKGFPSKGIVKIGRTAVTYTSITGNVLSSMKQDTEDMNRNYTHYKGTLCVLVYDGSSSNSTSLTTELNSSDTTITVADASSFDSSGSVIIGNEIISYTGKTSSSFTGCTRGASSSTASPHDVNVNVFQYDSTKHYTTSNPQAGTTMADEYTQLKQEKIVDPTKETEAQMEQEASKFLYRNATITYKIRFNVMDYFDFLDNADIGDNIKITDSDTGLDDVYRVLGYDLVFENGAVSFSVDASNKKKTETTFFDKLIKTRRKIESRLTYSPS